MKVTKGGALVALVDDVLMNQNVCPGTNPGLLFPSSMIIYTNLDFFTGLCPRCASWENGFSRLNHKLSLSLSLSLRKLECRYCIIYNLLISMFRKKEGEREQERERQIEKRGTEKERPSWCGVVRRRETEAESSLSEHSSLWGLSR